MPHTTGMKWKSLLGWGIVIYAIMSLVWSGLVTWNLDEGFLPRLFIFVAVAVTSIIAARTLRLSSRRDILAYSFGWVVIMAMLDVLFAVPVGGWGIYADANLWVMYALVAGAPLLAPSSRSRRDAPKVS